MQRYRIFSFYFSTFASKLPNNQNNENQVYSSTYVSSDGLLYEIRNNRHRTRQ